MIVSEFVTFFLGLDIAYMWMEAGSDGPWGVGPFLTLHILVNVIFRYVFPARCPANGCGSKCFPTGKNPIIYRCRVCDYEYETGVSTGRRG
jgi:hypothetical protein